MMNVRERMLALRLKEKVAHNPQYAEHIGIGVNILYTAKKDTRVRGEKRHGK